MEQNKDNFGKDFLRIFREEALRAIITGLIVLAICLFFGNHPTFNFFGIDICMPSVENFQLPSFKDLRYQIPNIYALNFQHVIALLVCSFLVPSFSFAIIGTPKSDASAMFFLISFIAFVLIGNTYWITSSFIMTFIICSSFLIVFLLDFKLGEGCIIAVLLSIALLFIVIYWTYMLSYPCFVYFFTD